MERRIFLGTLVASFLAACTADGEEASPGSISPSTSPTTQPAATTSSPSPTTRAAPIVEQLDPPAADLAVDTFALGVASGEPNHESVVLWTRLVGELPETIDIVWEVSREQDFGTLSATGLATVERATAHSAHVVAADLAPDEQYWYRFRAGTITSPAGRTRTMPLPDDQRPIALGISSCQARSDGEWAAHRDLSTADIDVVVWLGDYIYGEHNTLDEYRREYERYRADPLLQACHAAHPWILFADDHEVTNDYNAAVDPVRRGAAYQAWWEHQPTRLDPPDANGSLSFHRSFSLGGAAHLIGLDVRQYANDQQLLGEAQWEVLEEATRASTGHTVVASPVLMTGLRDLEGLPLLGYSIDAYREEQERMASLLGSAASPVIVSGDLHTSLVADFSADPLDDNSPPVAVELMAPAVSSAFPERFAQLAPFLPLVNPKVRSVEVKNGWLRLDLRPDGISAEFHFVDDVGDPASAITVRPITL